LCSREADLLDDARTPVSVEVDGQRAEDIANPQEDRQPLEPTAEELPQHVKYPDEGVYPLEPAGERLGRVEVGTLQALIGDDERIRSRGFEFRRHEVE